MYVLRQYDYNVNRMYHFIRLSQFGSVFSDVNIDNATRFKTIQDAEDQVKLIKSFHPDTNFEIIRISKSYPFIHNV